jgi:pyruvate dehydrogenase E1 component alpha subunit/2-oxoisovalerate dehydrogenase E1 component alpha subunit
VPQHGSWRSVHVVSASTPIGSQLVHAVGVARGMQQAGRGEVAVALAGQAAVATGDFHCALNFAAVQDAPAIFVLTSDERLGDHTATAGIAPKAAAYGLPGVVVDGGDVDAVLDAVARARERARSGAGPTLVEAVVPTPPPCGPTAGPRPLGAPWDDVDPVARHERRLLHAGLLAPEAADDARRHAKDAVASAVTWARALPPPPGDTLVADVFARPTPALAAQRDLWRAPRAARQET